MTDPINVRTHALALFMTIYAVSETGGPVHVQLDDDNLEDEHLAYGLYDQWNSPMVGWTPHSPEVSLRVETAAVELLEILKSWPLDERERFVSFAHEVHSAVAYHWDGEWDGPRDS